MPEYTPGPMLTRLLRVQGIRATRHATHNSYVLAWATRTSFTYRSPWCFFFVITGTLRSMGFLGLLIACGGTPTSALIHADHRGMQLLCAWVHARGRVHTVMDAYTGSHTHAPLYTRTWMHTDCGHSVGTRTLSTIAHGSFCI